MKTQKKTKKARTKKSDGNLSETTLKPDIWEDRVRISESGITKSGKPGAWKSSDSSDPEQDPNNETILILIIHFSFPAVPYYLGSGWTLTRSPSKKKSTEGATGH